MILLINDDLDSFVNNLQNSKEIEYEFNWSFCLPKLTKEELKLVEQKNEEHMMTYLYSNLNAGFNADVAVEDMKKSDSKDKYVFTHCHRITDYLTLESEQTSFEDFSEDVSSNSSSPLRKRIRK